MQSSFAWGRLNAFCKKHRRRIRSLLRAKREPERTAVPAGHESPSGAFKPQTGLRSKCRVFSAARPQRFQRAGSMKKGLHAPNNPKAVGLHTKNPSRFAKGFFVLRRFVAPSAAAAAAPRGGAGLNLTLALPTARQRQADSSKMPFAVTTPSCEKANQKSPQAFLICKYKNNISAENAQSETEGILNRQT